MTVNQHHSEHEPLFEDRMVKLNRETGQVDEIFTPKLIRHPQGGSLQIKSDGKRVSLSGNPSHWGRRTNVDGIEIDLAKEIYNQILAEHGLPIFTNGEGGSNPDNKARVSRLDLCVDLVTGGPGQKRELLLRQQGIQFPRLRKSLNGTSTQYGMGSASRNWRIYDKAQEFVEKRKVLSPQDSKLAILLEALGIVRYETQMHQYLRAKNMRHWDDLTSEKAHEIIKKEMQKMINDAEEQSHYETSMAMLSPNARMWYHAWRAGEDIKQLGSRNTIQKYRNEISSVMQVDIMSTEIHALPIRNRTRIELRQLETSDLKGLV